MPISSESRSAGFARRISPPKVLAIAARTISALRVGHLTSATNFFVNVVGGSKAQINAIVKSIEDDVDEQFDRRAHRQGKAVSGWVCLDYDEVRAVCM